MDPCKMAREDQTMSIRLSPQGRSRAPHSYNEFAVSFLNALVETVPEEQVSAVWSKQWSRKAKEYRDRIGSDSLKERITNLVRLPFR